jgi:hypothetical protein
MGTETEPRLRLTRLRLTPRGGLPTWSVIGHPFRLVESTGGWLVVPLDQDARGLLIRHDLLAQPWRTRSAAVQALTKAVAGRAARPIGRR